MSNFVDLGAEGTGNLIRGKFRRLFAWVTVMAGVDSTGQPRALSCAADGSLVSSTTTELTTPVQTQPTVTDVSSALAAANRAGQNVALFNNGLTSIWVALDGTAPVADTGSEGTPNGDGKGIRIYPGGFYETPARITTAINGITLTGTAKVTVILS